jgi:ABC-type transport system involved in cytochrome bd biosynthesis fused ATPase/permease subunit
VNASDPVAARREQVRRWALVANRVGYLLFGVAIVVFVVAFAVGFTGPLVAVVTTCLVIGSLLLAPAIIAGYAVKAAEREDRERANRHG